MTDRPIIFSAPMVRALLDGRKTQTRRLLRPQPTLAKVSRFQHVATEKATGRAIWEAHDSAGPVNAFRSGKHCVTCLVFTPEVGDRLWVRESFCKFDPSHVMQGMRCAYMADTARGSDTDRIRKEYGYRWKPSIHMPRWASRLTLVVTGVKIERLHDISDADKIAEGATPDVPFGTVWRQIHGDAGWSANPWVAAISFRVKKRNIDAKAEAAA